MLRMSRQTLQLDWIKKGYLALFLLIPLIFNPWGFDVYEIPKNVLLKIGVSLLCGGLLFLSLTQGKVIVPLSRRLRLGLSAIVGTAALALLFSERPEVSFWGSYFRQGGVINLLLYLFLFWLGLYFFRSKEKAAVEMLFFKVVALGGVLTSVYAVFQYFGFDIYAHEVTDVFAGRSFATLGNPTALGTALLFPVGACLFGLFNDVKYRGLYAAALALILTAIFMSSSRGALLGLGVCSGLWMLRLLKAKKRVLLPLLLLGVLVALVGVTNFSSSLRSVFSRFVIWESSIQMVQEQPWMGVGPENFSYGFESHVKEDFFLYEDYKDLVDRPHNEVLEVQLSYGILGTLLYLSLIVFLIFNFFRAQRPAEVWASFTLLSLFFANQFGFSLVTQFFFASGFLSLIFSTEKLPEKKMLLRHQAVAFLGLALLLFNLCFGIRLALTDWNLKQAFNSIYASDFEGMNGHIEEALRFGGVYGEVYTKAYSLYYAAAGATQNDEYLRAAVAANEEAKRIQGNSLLNRLNDASVHALAGKTEEAEGIYRKAWEELSPNPVLFEKWAELHYEMEDYEEAARLYEAFFALLPSSWQDLEPYASDEARIFWKNHPEVSLSLARWAGCYEQLGKTEAFEELKQTLQ